MPYPLFDRNFKNPKLKAEPPVKRQTQGGLGEKPHSVWEMPQPSPVYPEVNGGLQGLPLTLQDVKIILIFSFDLSIPQDPFRINAPQELARELLVLDGLFES
jgi:hypothetical protein